MEREDVPSWRREEKIIKKYYITPKDPPFFSWVIIVICRKTSLLDEVLEYIVKYRILWARLIFPRVIDL